MDDGNGKSTPVKRGPGRPRKRKYFGASSKGEKPSPVATADEDKEGAESLPASGAQSPESNAVASESESLVSKESEPPKKKKKRSKQKSPVEQEGRGTATPTLGISPMELAVSVMVFCGYLLQCNRLVRLKSFTICTALLPYRGYIL